MQVSIVPGLTGVAFHSTIVCKGICAVYHNIPWYAIQAQRCARACVQAASPPPPTAAVGCLASLPAWNRTDGGVKPHGLETRQRTRHFRAALRAVDKPHAAEPHARDLVRQELDPIGVHRDGVRRLAIAEEPERRSAEGSCVCSYVWRRGKRLSSVVAHRFLVRRARAGRYRARSVSEPRPSTCCRSQKVRTAVPRPSRT